MTSLRRNTSKIILALMLVLLGAWLVRLTDARQLLRQSLHWIDGLGAWAPVWFVAAYVAACLTFFPGFILTMGGGVLFGVVKGTWWVSVGATLGAGCAFLVSRHLARDWIQRKLGQNARFQAIDEAVARDGWKIVGLLRLSPVIPFIPMNFVFGLTKIPFFQFVAITWLSILPMSCMFVYLGSLVGDIAALGTQPVAAGRAKWIVSGIGVAMTIVATIFITRIARRALNAKMPS